MSDVNDHPLDQLSSYLDDELELDARERIDGHLASCSACREHLEALRQLSRAIGAETVPSPPDGLEEKVLRRLDAAAVVPFRRRVIVPASVAATVAAVGLLVVIVWKQGGPGVAPLPEQELGPTSGSLERGQAEERKEADDSARRLTPPPAQAPAPPPPAAAVPPETPARKREGTEPKARRNDRFADRVAARVVPPQPIDTSGAAGAKDQPAPLAAKRADAPLHVAEAAPSGVQSLSKANGPVVSCAQGTVDSTLRAVWEVADPADAARRLALLAAVHGGRVEPQAGGRVDRLTVVVPASGFAAFARAASSIGVEGVDRATPPVEAGCVRQHIDLATVVRR